MKRNLPILLLVAVIGLATFVTYQTVTTSPELRAARSREAAAQATKAEAAAQTVVETKDAAVFARRAVFVGGGLAALVFLVGGSYVFVVYLARRAATIPPGPSGQFPLVRIRGQGWSGVFDPNRSPSSVTVFKGPTVVDVLQRRGVTPQIAQPTPLSEGATLALAGQATAAAMVAGATRHPTTSRAGILGAVEAVNRPVTLSSPFPTVEVVEDADHIERLLQLTAPDDYFDVVEP